jgi:HK97 family phage major capsid protein
MSLIETMREKRAAAVQSLETLLADNRDGSKRSLSAEDDAKVTDGFAEIRKYDERIGELTELEARTAADAKANLEMGTVDIPGEKRDGGAKVTEPLVYRKDNVSQHSYFTDLYRAQHKQDREAEARLRRSDAQVTEKRALGNTNAVQGSGGEFAPPLWLVDEYVKLARPGRIGADLFTKAELPAGVSSVNIPRVATGTTVAPQTTQNTALSQTDLTTNSLSSNIVTIGGKQVVSLQLLEQSAIPFDMVILQDLALAYAGQLDVQALTGLGTSGSLRGLGSAAGLTAQAYTQATPAVAGAGGLYAQIQKAIASVYATRFLAPDTILMHPRRWSFIAASFDSANRPLVVPVGNAYNPIGTQDDEVAQGKVGNIAGLDVFVDPNLPTNLGTGTNQDPIYVFRRSDVMLWETAPRAETFTQPYADTMGILFRLFAYAAMVPDRYGSSIVQVNGTGTVTPTY